MLWKLNTQVMLQKKDILFVISAILLQTVEDLKTNGQKIRHFSGVLSQSYTSKKRCEYIYTMFKALQANTNGLCNRFQGDNQME